MLPIESHGLGLQKAFLVSETIFNITWKKKNYV